MYKRELEQVLHTKKLEPFILLYGECDFQNNYFSEKILSYWNTSEDEKLLVHYDEYDFSHAKNFLSQSSLFGGNNILVLKTDKLLPQKELDILIDLSKKSQESYFLYQYFGDATKAKKLTKSFGKNFVRFFKPAISEALQLLQQKAKDVGLNIQGYALSHLYQLHMENLSLCVNEFEKLKLFNKEITVNDIDKVVYGLGSVGMDKFIETLLKKEGISIAFQNLFENALADEVRIINAIQAYLSNLLLFHLYIKIHGNYDAKEILGFPLPLQIAKQRASDSIKINLNTYKKLYEVLLNTELKLKKMKDIDKNTLLLSSLIQLQKLL